MTSTPPLKPTSLASLVVAVAAIVAAGATPMSAQSSGSQGGLPAGGRSDPNARQKLNITLSSSGAHDSDASPEARTAIGIGAPEAAGYSTTLAGAAGYLVQGRRVQFRATGASTLRYYRRPEEVLSSFDEVVSHTAAVGLTARLTPRTALVVSQTATSSPSHLYDLFASPTDAAPGEAPPLAPDYAINGSTSHTYSTSMMLTRDLSRRNSLSAVANYQSTDTAVLFEGGRALNSYGIQTGFSRHLTKNAMATAGYRFTLGEIGSGIASTTPLALVEHGVEVGLDYARPLSASRSLTFGGRIGSSTMRLPEFPEGVGPISGRTNRLSGRASFGYQFLRTWRASAIYIRGVEYVPGLRVPVAKDSFTTGIGGALARRVNVLASAAYSSGGSALNPNGSSFDTYTGNVNLGYALTRTFSTYVEYLYYFYDSRGAPLAPGIPSGLERKGVRVGLTLQVPVL